MAASFASAIDGLPSRATVVDVGLRDGLQAVTSVVPTDAKLEILHGLVDAGVTTVEITSFAHPRVLPQFADAADVVAQAPRRNGVRYRALVPNLRGAQRACDTAIDEVVMVVPVDPGMAAKNQNSTPERLLAEFDNAVEFAHAAGKTVVAAVATAFFAPCRGVVPEADLTRVVRRVVDGGADGLYLAGTTGMESPGEFYDGVRRYRAQHPGLPIGVHLHNRNGLSTVDALASLAAGADWIEGSFGGLGGDLWFPGDDSVLGNAAVEDLLVLLHGLGIDTGIDEARYGDVVARAAEITGVPAYSFVARGGTRDALAAASWPDSPPVTR
ncbi:hydroxymethylglutaryl-CoA lyase [Rhodococcus kroppenstedtii]|uniref:hydroxymethylglutaryl-CoA lyase n=1 Tax=Rhodococcoides kroppenstedtii TaxID=293050 RepID=UPI001C9B56BA|nr:hydroxymethylglutaryl-CoA lyase [Rhodococcus kroppenstedtii]MBY6436882.1 hydroxymethylglutaryl-CoA lyase [Rhodococcus kroppenstedtii]